MYVASETRHGERGKIPDFTEHFSHANTMYLEILGKSQRNLISFSLNKMTKSVDAENTIHNVFNFNSGVGLYRMESYLKV